MRRFAFISLIIPHAIIAADEWERYVYTRTSPGG